MPQTLTKTINKNISRLIFVAEGSKEPGAGSNVPELDYEDCDYCLRLSHYTLHIIES